MKYPVQFPTGSFRGILLVYVIAREGVNFGINFTSCSENGNEIARGTAECYFAVIATTIEWNLSHVPFYSLLTVKKWNSMLIGQWPWIVQTVATESLK